MKKADEAQVMQKVEKVVGGIGMERSVRRKESLSLFTHAILGTTASIE